MGQHDGHNDHDNPRPTPAPDAPADAGGGVVPLDQQPTPADIPAQTQSAANLAPGQGSVAATGGHGPGGNAAGTTYSVGGPGGGQWSSSAAINATAAPADARNDPGALTAGAAGGSAAYAANLDHRRDGDDRHHTGAALAAGATVAPDGTTVVSGSGTISTGGHDVTQPRYQAGVGVSGTDGTSTFGSRTVHGGRGDASVIGIVNSDSGPGEQAPRAWVSGELVAGGGSGPHGPATHVGGTVAAGVHFPVGPLVGSLDASVGVDQSQVGGAGQTAVNVLGGFGLAAPAPRPRPDAPSAPAQEPHQPLSAAEISQLQAQQPSIQTHGVEYNAGRPFEFSGRVSQDRNDPSRLVLTRGPNQSIDVDRAQLERASHMNPRDFDQLVENGGRVDLRVSPAGEMMALAPAERDASRAPNRSER